ncbi:hypothetical protein D5K58_15490, partial [Listeria monocytogenes]|nr:hypothetical protein [Listeria monocytogenes]EAH0903360.1 hypothetical protein [Listeria monocytogenes]EAH2662257.1 hypothetical protein [Listeria monocytogenes]
MSSELVKKLEKEYADYIRSGEIEIAIGIGESIRIVKEHEAQQTKEPFYQLDEKQQNLLNELKIVSREIKCLDLDEVLDKCYHKRLVNEQLAILWESLDVTPKNQVFNAFTTWAIEQEKLEEEEA